ncbi:hypothetical protein ACFSL4_30500 [Streptomyces caeni]|uniref:MarR family transcriptional regulator n=1 Tax=Streptomyces caeni TaxID=2307231 RepID=A0ABW4J0C4_9ACTN
MEPTPAGEDCLRRGEQARREEEHRFLAPLDEEEAAVVRTLRLLLESHGPWK